MNERVPTELKFKTLYDIPFPDILNVYQCSTEYQDICNDPNFWRLKAEHQLGVSPRRFNKTQRSARERFIELYTRKYPIPGCQKYNKPIFCIRGLLDLIAEGYV